MYNFTSTFAIYRVLFSIAHFIVVRLYLCTSYILPLSSLLTHCFLRPCSAFFYFRFTFLSHSLSLRSSITWRCQQEESHPIVCCPASISHLEPHAICLSTWSVHQYLSAVVMVRHTPCNSFVNVIICPATYSAVNYTAA